MDKLIIQKPALKFMVEVSSGEGELIFNVNRYIDASHQEEMAFSAQLAKYDAIKCKDRFHNCHELIHKLLKFMQTELAPVGDKPKVKMTLRRSRTFGKY
ncbi:hypothetical protein LVD15_04410 [Fulvivirga maritima]|uniref:hypothetical protein n=1 Tax=Fulvivirga maritima TaxID=2904247 RepID=UPI001F3F51BC|nr:hypothetical protein [Fulvivirga maritima]UII27673.1 hypothetical protein LVD15_04410 [Fulvivirga maritima]